MFFILSVLLSTAVASPLSRNAAANVSEETTVQCYSGTDCKEPGQEMTMRDCCLNKTMFSYSTPDSCNLCTVYGWLEESLETVERKKPYYLRVGFIKGSGDDELKFRITVEECNTQNNVDYTVTPQQLTVGASTTTVEVNILLDGVALEPEEHFKLKLELLSNKTFGVFRDIIDISINDSDELEIFLTSREYRASEEKKTMTIGVTKNKQIATPLSLTITPQTAAQAETFNDTSLSKIPEGNPRIQKATVISDFDGTPIQVEFLPEQYTPVNDLTVDVSIIDDDLNEAQEEYFYIRLDSNNPSVNVTGSRFSLCKIVDNDPIQLGFSNSSHEIMLSQFNISEETYVEIVSEDNRLSQQSFNVEIQAIVASPSPEIGVLNNKMINTLIHSKFHTFILPFDSYASSTKVHITLDYHTVEEIRNQHKGPVAFELVIIGNAFSPDFLHANKLSQFTFIVME